MGVRRIRAAIMAIRCGFWPYTLKEYLLSLGHEKNSVKGWNSRSGAGRGFLPP